MSVLGLRLAGAFLLGAALGSFMNVCVYRLPRDRSVVRGRSQCPHCGSVIRWYDNIPLLSYVFLKGRCRHCGERIPFGYFTGELIGGGVMAVAGWIWLRDPSPDLLNFLITGSFVLVTLAITLIDSEYAIIPNELSYGLIVSGLFFGTVPHYPFAVSETFPAWNQFVLSVVGMLAGGGLFLLLALVSPLLYGKPALGMGDVKLMAAFGAWLGPQLVFLTMILGSILGAVIGTALVTWRGESLRTEIPFGPFLCGAALIALMVGRDLIAWYVQMM